MPRPRIVFVIGARPQFIKSATVVRELLRRHRIQLLLVHSGQHYDPEMSDIFFNQLQIPTPSANLRVGSGSHASQTAAIMKGLEPLLVTQEPQLLMVPGDTNTTLGAALCAAKLGIPVAHVEAGLRSGDMSMPEEINRKLTDHCSSILFAPTQTAVSNLKREGLQKLTRLTGDTMVDALVSVMPVVERRRRSVLDRFRLVEREYVLVTLHRPSNVDDPKRLREIMHALRQVARRLPVLFPVHPRTRARLLGSGALGKSGRRAISLVPPQGYVETLALLRNASSLLTDSGGMQKESFILHTPCITLRSTTEWPETLVARANRLVTSPNAIPPEILHIASDERLRTRISRLRNPFGDGRASARIAGIIEQMVD